MALFFSGRAGRERGFFYSLNVEVSGLHGFSRRSARLPGWTKPLRGGIACCDGTVKTGSVTNGTYLTTMPLKNKELLY